VIGALALSALRSSGCAQDETVLRELSVQTIHVRQQALCRDHHRQLPRRRHQSVPPSPPLVPAHTVAVWVNDYHLLLLPALLRADPKLANAPIGFFLHVAFPSSEIFRYLAVRESLIMSEILFFHFKLITR
jgi:hypothetical protein